MNCEILETLYLRSNGDVPCNDDAGEQVLLGLVRPQSANWSASSLLFNHHYRHIREALRRGQMPWPEVCRRCAFLRPNEPFADPLAQRRLRKIQVEPSLACRLRCPGCSNHVQVRVRPQPLFMDLAMFGRILRRLREEDFSVGDIEYCGQGEPLLHPRFPEFVRTARENFPATHQRLITSGNFDFQAATGSAALDEIMVSCDGVFPESYARYRVGGRVEQAIQFMRDARASGGERRLMLVWKYILFEWNDHTEELLAAQQLASEIGVDYLLFVYTHSVGKSRRYTVENVGELPVRFANVTTNATPIHYRLSVEPAPPTPEIALSA